MSTQYSPFKFLDAYEREDKDKFFGRDQEIDQLVELVFETKLILVYGASGVGKTSLLRCGLSNRFNHTQWLDLFIRKRENIVESLHAAVSSRILQSDPKVTIGDDLIDALRLLYLYNFRPIYLIFDQFEELFIFGEEPEQQAFFEFINRLIRSDLPCKVLLSMREEYIAYLSDFEKNVPILFDNRLRIEKMTRTALTEVLRGTTSAYEIETEEQAIETIIAGLSDKRGFDLTHLQVYLDRLYRMDMERKGTEERPIRFDRELVSQISTMNVLGAFLDEQLLQLENELGNKGITKDVLFFLVSDEGTKQAIEVDLIKESLLRRKNINPADVDYCIRRFAEMRIFKELDE